MFIRRITNKRVKRINEKDGEKESNKFETCLFSKYYFAVFSFEFDNIKIQMNLIMLRFK